jgi:hypothetical protein
MQMASKIRRKAKAKPRTPGETVNKGAAKDNDVSLSRLAVEFDDVSTCARDDADTGTGRAARWSDRPGMSAFSGGKAVL